MLQHNPEPSIVMNRVDLSRLEYLDESIVGIHGTPFTGVAFAMHSTGHLAYEAEFLDGVVNGHVREWYENGQKKLDSIRLGEAENGGVIEWYPDGVKKREAQCELGVCLFSKTWDESGRLMEDCELKASDPAYRLLELNRAVVGQRK